MGALGESMMIGRKIATRTRAGVQTVVGTSELDLRASTVQNPVLGARAVTVVTDHKK